MEDSNSCLDESPLPSLSDRIRFFQSGKVGSADLFQVEEENEEEEDAKDVSIDYSALPPVSVRKKIFGHSNNTKSTEDIGDYQARAAPTNSVSYRRNIYENKNVAKPKQQIVDIISGSKEDNTQEELPPLKDLVKKFDSFRPKKKYGAFKPKLKMNNNTSSPRLGIAPMIGGDATIQSSPSSSLSSLIVDVPSSPTVLLNPILPRKSFPCSHVTAYSPSKVQNNANGIVSPLQNPKRMSSPGGLKLPYNRYSITNYVSSMSLTDSFIRKNEDQLLVITDDWDHGSMTSSSISEI